MFNIRSYIVFIFALLFAFLLELGIASQGVHAAYLRFDKTTVNVTVGSTFTLDAVVEAGSDQVTSTDMWIIYNPTILEAQTASSGAYFPTVTNNISSGKIYIAGLVTDPGTYKTGSGSVATITFKALTNGTVTIAYDCRTDVSNSSKVIKNSVDPANIIVCSQNTTSVITAGTGGTVAPTSIVPTSIVPTSVYTAPQVYPSTLPQTGLADEMPKIITMGILFVIVGAALRALLLL